MYVSSFIVSEATQFSTTLSLATRGRSVVALLLKMSAAFVFNFRG